MDCSHQASLSIGFSRQEYWSGLPCPPPGDLPDTGIKPTPLASPALTHRETLCAVGSPTNTENLPQKITTPPLRGFLVGKQIQALTCQWESQRALSCLSQTCYGGASIWPSAWTPCQRFGSWYTRKGGWQDISGRIHRACYRRSPWFLEMPAHQWTTVFPPTPAPPVTHQLWFCSILLRATRPTLRASLGFCCFQPMNAERKTNVE